MTRFIEGVQIPEKCQDCPEVCHMEAVVGRAKQMVQVSTKMAEMFFDSRGDAALGIMTTIRGSLGDEVAAEIDINTDMEQAGKELGDNWEAAEADHRAAVTDLRELVTFCSGSLLMRAETPQGKVEVRICRSPEVRSKKHQPAHIQWRASD